MLRKTLLGMAVVAMGLFTLTSTPEINAQGSVIELHKAWTDTGDSVLYGATSFVPNWSSGAYWQGEVPTGIPFGGYFNVNTSIDWTELGAWDFGQGAPTVISQDAGGDSIGEVLLLVDNLTGTGFYRMDVSFSSGQELTVNKTIVSIDIAD